MGEEGERGWLHIALEANIREEVGEGESRIPFLYISPLFATNHEKKRGGMHAYTACANSDLYTHVSLR